MVHNWTKGTVGNGATARVILFDYRKSFDLIDHSIVVGNLGRLDLPNNIINWPGLLTFYLTVLSESNYVKAASLSGNLCHRYPI